MWVNVCVPGTPCDVEGNFQPLGTAPSPREFSALGPDDWTPFGPGSREIADLLFRKVEMSPTNIDALFDLWGVSSDDLGGTGPFDSHADMYEAIDASRLSAIPWRCMEVLPQIFDPKTAPQWQHKTYQIWYRDPALT